MLCSLLESGRTGMDGHSNDGLWISADDADNDELSVDAEMLFDAEDVMYLLT